MAELTKERKDEIETIASSIREEYHLSPNFDLIEFLTNRQDYEIRLQQIGDDTTGLLFINELKKVEKSDSHNVIIINSKLMKDRYFEQKRRFICAHEYGHAVLHKGDQKVFARRDTDAKESEEEQEAEFFAYCLLLSKQAIDMLLKTPETLALIKKLKVRLKRSTGEVLALLFNVTPQKAQERLKQLGYAKI